jgi:hypothetical protein
MPSDIDELGKWPPWVGGWGRTSLVRAWEGGRVKRRQCGLGSEGRRLWYQLVRTWRSSTPIWKDTEKRRSPAAQRIHEGEKQRQEI